MYYYCQKQNIKCILFYIGYSKSLCHYCGTHFNLVYAGTSEYI